MTSPRSILPLLAAAFLTVGCYFNPGDPGGMGWSMDRYVYQSHEWQPWTIALIDTRTGETLWSVDVPVGKQLVMGFRKGVGPNETKPDMMYWGITEWGRTVSRQDNSIPVPGRYARRIDATLRATPELPATPLPGSPFAETEPPPAPPPPPTPEPTAAPESATPPAEAPKEEPPPADEPPPIDLPQGTRKPG